MTSFYFEAAAPKLVLLPACPSKLHRNSFRCQRGPRDYSETQFAASVTLDDMTRTQRNRGRFWKRGLLRPTMSLTTRNDDGRKTASKFPNGFGELVRGFIGRSRPLHKGAEASLGRLMQTGCDRRPPTAPADCWYRRGRDCRWGLLAHRFLGVRPRF